jgi:GntR family transcriptional regulator
MAQTNSRRRSARRPPVPAHDYTLSRRLRELARRAGLRGQPLPAETALAARLGVSRPALREELARLESEGLIRRRQGAPTLVNPAAFEVVARFDQQVEFANVLRDAGYTPTVEVLESEPVNLSAADAEALDVEPGTDALRTVKRWRADGRPVMLAVDVIPVLDGRHGRLARIDAEAGLFALVHALRGDGVEWEVAWPGAAVVTQDVRSRLEMKRGQVVLTLDLVGVSKSGQRAYRAMEYHVPGVVRSGFVRSIRT